MEKDNLIKIYNDIINDEANKEYKVKGYRPLYFVNSNSKILIIGQAPGIKAQETHKVFNDKSGDILREWLGVSKQEFYDENIFSIMPMDFFYPGKGKTGDLPPRKGFASKWHPKIINELKSLKLIILVGLYAVEFYLKDVMEKNLTETIKNYQKYLPLYFPIVHPSPLNFRWHNKNTWFKKEPLKDLKILVRKIINTNN